MFILRAPIVLALALVTADALGDPPSPPPGRPAVAPSRLVDVEIKDEDKARSSSTHFMVAVGASGATATVTSPVGEEFYSVKLRHDAPGTYVLQLARHPKTPTAAHAELEL